MAQARLAGSRALAGGLGGAPRVGLANRGLPPDDGDTDDGADDDEDTGGTTTLPDTGSGLPVDADREAAVGLLLVAAVVLAMAGHAVLRGTHPATPR